MSLATTAALIAGIGVAAAVAGFLDSLNTPPRWTARAPDPNMLVRVSPVRNYGSYTAIGPRLRTLDVAVYRRVTASTGRGPFAAPLQLECVSPAYLALLGVRPFAGRDFDARDDVEGGPPTVVLAHHFWMRRFGGDPAVLGTGMQVDDRLHTIIGVGPPDFGGVDSPPADAWTLLAASPNFCDASGRPILDQGAWLQTVGRVRPGFTVRTPTPRWRRCWRPARSRRGGSAAESWSRCTAGAPPTGRPRGGSAGSWPRVSCSCCWWCA